MGMQDTMLSGRKEIAGYLKIHPDTLDKLRKNNNPPPISRLGPRLLVADMLDLDRWIKSRRETNVPE